MSKTIPLTQGQFAIVDDEDYVVLSRFEWFAAEEDGKYYARRKIRTVKQNGESVGDVYLAMESMIIPPKQYSLICHKNKNRLDCRKENLAYESFSIKRHAADKQKGKTTSKYKGVSLRKVGFPKGKPWSACITKSNGKERGQFYLGCYATEREAALVWNEKARELYGELAYQNKIDSHD